MARLSLITLFLCLLTKIAMASPGPIPGTAPILPPGPLLSPGTQCTAAIVAAERGHGIPPQLMAAIGRVESGKKDPLTGVWGAWPWTINAEGQGAYFASKAEAIAAVEALRARGVRSIDVGCMQVNLMHHPAAFANLDQAFEPGVNADYAARFLVRLYGQTNDWTKATANYHSANPAEGEPYAAKVAAIWPEEQHKAGQTPPAALPYGLAPGGLFASKAPAFPMQTPPQTTPINGPGAASSQPGAIIGHGLDFYRAMPVRGVTPARLTLRMPFGVLTR